MKTCIYYILYSLLYLISLLPLRILYVFSDLMYPFIRLYRNKIVRQNMSEVFPDRSKEELRKMESQFYHQLADYIVETIKLFSISKSQLMKRMTFSGFEEMNHGFDDLKIDALFAYLGHYGNWEWIASLQYWAGDVHCCQIYHPLRNHVFDRMFLKIRQQYGGECIPMKQTLRRLLKLRHEGKRFICGFISDQQPKWVAIHHFTPFLNHDTAVFTGTEQLAKQMNAMIFYAHVTRPKRGYYHCHFQLMTYTPKEFEDYQLTDRFMQLLQKDIEDNPSLWLWTHKRWSRTKEEWLKRNNIDGNNSEG